MQIISNGYQPPVIARTVRMARSAIGKRACLVNLTDRDTLIAIRAYLDSSGKLGTKCLTLAAFAGNDNIWDEFETEWAKILDRHMPKAAYVHMREISFRIKGFASTLGWTDDIAFNLVNTCLAYMNVLDKKTIPDVLLRCRFGRLGQIES
jgi:hypothetical protein